MEKKFGINKDGVHLLCGGGVEYAICGFPVNVDPGEKEVAERGNIEPTPETTVTCPTCSYFIKLCRDVVVGTDSEPK